MRTIHDRERDTRSNRFSQNKGETSAYKVDFSRVMTERGETVSSVEWSSIDGQSSISNESLASNVATADITASKSGTALVKVTATQSDGNTRIKWLEIQVIDPEYTNKDYV